MSLAYYYSLLRLKEEQLQRLQLCNGELKSFQRILPIMKDWCQNLSFLQTHGMEHSPMHLII